MQCTLFVLAAGMGSRYGGLKQLDQVGPSGETIIDYSVYDAIRAGFDKVVFVIRENIEEDFKAVYQGRFGDRIKVEYVFQELYKIPEGFHVPEDREKPWGTCHAVMMGAEKINEPFAVINADDFYGADAFKKMAGFFSDSGKEESKTYCMVGYEVNKTLSEHGFVSRGVCEVSGEGNLTGVVEREKIGWDNNRIVYKTAGDKTIELSGEEIVSMNMWGFKPSFFQYAERDFKKFLQDNIHQPKTEFLIPSVINKLVDENEITLKVLSTSSNWFGVTYKEDKPVVIKKIRELVEKGEYPDKLWG